jgi:serine/threonine-protein kinase RsbW
VAAVPASLESIHDLVERLWSGLVDVSPADRVRFETAVVEVAGNIIEHAGPTDDGSPVWLTFTAKAGPSLIQGEFTDDGGRSEVDLAAVQMPGVDAEDGRGLALALALCDEVRYERLGAANRWTLVCHRALIP